MSEKVPLLRIWADAFKVTVNIFTGDGRHFQISGLRAAGSLKEKIGDGRHHRVPSENEVQSALDNPREIILHAEYSKQNVSISRDKLYELAEKLEAPDFSGA